eukprot:359468-Chlamydomonas_euryale.AAC.4
MVLTGVAAVWSMPGGEMEWKRKSCRFTLAVDKTEPHFGRQSRGVAPSLRMWRPAQSIRAIDNSSSGAQTPRRRQLLLWGAAEAGSYHPLGCLHLSSLLATAVPFSLMLKRMASFRAAISLYPRPLLAAAAATVLQLTSHSSFQSPQLQSHLPALSQQLRPLRVPEAHCCGQWSNQAVGPCVAYVGDFNPRPMQLLGHVFSVCGRGCVTFQAGQPPPAELVVRSHPAHPPSLLNDCRQGTDRV